MSTTALSCGNVDRTARPCGHGVRWLDVPATPGRADVDSLLADLEGRLLVHGTDADLAAVVLRLLRKDRIAHVEVGYVPVAESPATRLYGLATGDAGFEQALHGAVRPVPLVRDDSGGVLVASGVVEPITGQVYCDDQQVLNGSALRMEVAPDPDAARLPEPTSDPLSAMLEPASDGIRVTTTRRAFLRRREEVVRGRALQASFRSATVVRDGVAHPRPAEKWGWYRHTEDLRLAAGR
ncbi:hypothetical protein HUO13_36115 [Saccharopolyspora erythraea]|nr:hypothetical protein HUO13_36115 [Saccharopolyspora erythraea]